MKKFKLFLISAVAAIALQGCDDDDNTHSISAPETQTSIVDAAVADGNFTTLVTALQTTGLDATLADLSSTYTVFAPTDQAFALLGDDTINSLLENTETLSDILTYHVISGSVDSAAATGLAGATATMVNGDDIGISLSGESLLINTATVTTADIITDNGIIHVIDAVILN